MDQTSHIYENILDNMSDGVLTVDLQGQIITFNPAAARIRTAAPIARGYGIMAFPLGIL